MHPSGDYRRQTFLETLYIDLLKSMKFQLQFSYTYEYKMRQSKTEFTRAGPKKDASRLQDSLTPHAPLGGLSQANIFGNLIHRPIEIRLSAKIPTLGEAVRALFSKWPPKYNI